MSGSDIDAGEGEYLMDHSAQICPLGPDGRYLTHFPHATTPGEIAATLEKFR